MCKLYLLGTLKFTCFYVIGMYLFESLLPGTYQEIHLRFPKCMRWSPGKIKCCADFTPNSRPWKQIWKSNKWKVSSDKAMCVLTSACPGEAVRPWTKSPTKSSIFYWQLFFLGCWFWMFRKLPAAKAGLTYMFLSSSGERFNGEASRCFYRNYCSALSAPDDKANFGGRWWRKFVKTDFQTKPKGCFSPLNAVISVDPDLIVTAKRPKMLLMRTFRQKLRNRLGVSVTQTAKG